MSLKSQNNQLYVIRGTDDVGRDNKTFIFSGSSSPTRFREVKWEKIPTPTKIKKIRNRLFEGDLTDQDLLDIETNEDEVASLAANLKSSLSKKDLDRLVAMLGD